MKVKIIDVHDADGWHDSKYDLKGVVGTISGNVTPKGNDFFSFKFTPDVDFEGNSHLYFARAKFKELT